MLPISDENAHCIYSFHCGQPGHRKSECPNGGGNACFRCGEFGHRKAECPNPPQGGGGGGGRPCFNCGELGHLKSECVNPTNPAAGGSSRTWSVSFYNDA